MILDQVSNLVSTGVVLNLMKDSFSVILLVSLMFYQNWKLATFAMVMIPLSVGLAKEPRERKWEKLLLKQVK